MTNSSPDSSTGAAETRDTDASADSRMPPAQDAANVPPEGMSPASLQTNPPSVDLPLTSSVGTGFDTPDAGTGVGGASVSAAGSEGAAQSSPSPDNAPLPQVGNIDRDALAGENAPAGLQADAEAVSSTGPV